MAVPSTSGNGLARVFGHRIPISKLTQKISRISELSAEEVARIFIVNNADQIGIPDVNHLRLAKVWHDKLSSGSLLTTVRFNQEFRNIPVLGGSVTITFREDDFVDFSSTFKSIGNLRSAPTLSKLAAEEVAIKAEMGQKHLPIYPRPGELDGLLSANPAELRIEYSRQVIVATDQERAPRLSWQIEFARTSSPPTKLSYLIDAELGTVVSRTDNILFDEVNGTLNAPVYMKYPSSSLPSGGQELKGMPYSRVSVREDPGVTDVTDEYGDFTLPFSSGQSGQFFTIYPAFRYLTKIFEPGNVEVNLELNSPPTTPPTSLTLNIGAIDNTYKQQASNILYHLARARYFFGRRFFGGSDVFNVPPYQTTIFIDESWNSTAPHSICGTDPNSGSFTGLEVHLTGAETSVPFYSGTYDLESIGVGADVILHELSHGMECALTLPSNAQITDVPQFLALREAYADYFAASIQNDPIVNEGLTTPAMVPNSTPISSDGTDLVRNLVNGYRFDVQYPTFNSKYDRALILSGAMWSFRANMIQLYGQDQGSLRADELIVSAIKRVPVTFADFMDSLLIVDDSFSSTGMNAEHLDQICAAFKDLHGIDHTYCPVTWTDPSGSAAYISHYDIAVPPATTFVIDDPSGVPILGNARPQNFESFNWFNLLLRPFGHTNWLSSEIVLTNGGSTPVTQNILGRVSSPALQNGCFYEGKLEVSTSEGVRTDLVTFRKRSGAMTEFPKMACVYMTEGHGNENKACEVIAIFSDPKDAFYQIPAQDWRRGTNPILPVPPGGSDQFSYYGDSMCDPDGGYSDPWYAPPSKDCADDCWNISGTAGNLHGNNDGLDNVFCAAGANCGGAPVSFSGCGSNDSNCILQALASLESVYHRVVYYHWAVGAANFAEIQDCGDDGGLHSYVLNGGWRRAQCSEPRCENPQTGDLLDGFKTLYDLEVDYDSADFFKYSRENGTPAENCSTCGCPSDRPYCNASINSCEAKCSDGTLFGQCTLNAGQGMYCDQGVSKLACGNRCPGASCPGWMSCGSAGWCEENTLQLAPTETKTMSYFPGSTDIYPGPLLSVGYSPGENYRAFLKFDLSATPPGNLEEAWLKLWMVDSWEGSPGPVPKVYLLDSDYGTLGEEDYSAPGALVGTLSTGGEPTQPFYVNVLPYLRSGINAFMLKSSSTNSSNFTGWTFASHQYSTQSLRPKMLYRKKSTGCVPRGGTSGGATGKVRPGPALSQVTYCY